MTQAFQLTRDEIARVFGTPRAVRTFEQLQEKVANTDEVVTAQIGATGALQQATFVTLSPNAELPNERVLSLGTGLGFDLSDGGVTVRLTGNPPRVSGGFKVQFTASGDCQLGLPLAGMLATRDYVDAAVSGGGGYSVATVSASYTETATSGEKVVRVTATGQTITLPTAAGNTARLTFKLMVAGTLTIDGAGAETIDGGATAVLTAQYEAITLVSDGTNWMLV